MRSLATEDLETATRPLKMSQTSLAAKLGVTPQAVSKWVRGLSEPDDATKEQLALLLGIPIPHWKKPPRGPRPEVETAKRKGKRTPKPRRAA